MKIVVRSSVAIFLIVFSAWASKANAESVNLKMDLYGRLDVAYDWLDLAEDDWFSHVSRIGVKGSYPLRENLSVIYQLEQSVDVVHGGTNVAEIFSTRNSFIGLSTAYGKFMFGTHDTPFKKAQGKIDLFNDQRGDISGSLVGEVRATDSFLYHSPKWSGWQLQAMYIPSDGHFDSSESISLTYQLDDWNFGVALDSDTRKNNKSVARTKLYDSVRASVQYSPGSWRLGFLVQQSEQQNSANASASASSEAGYVASVSYKWGKIVTIAQYSDSDIVASDVKNASLGIEYFLNKKTKLYLYYQDYARGVNTNTASLGFQWKF